MRVEVNTSNIVQNNEYQRNAITKALKSTFTLIHGPPGIYANEILVENLNLECLKWKVCFAVAHNMLKATFRQSLFTIPWFFFLVAVPTHVFWIIIPFINTIQGTGKTYTGTKLVYIFDKINSRMQTEGHDKKQLVFCGPNNKSVDLVASKFFSYKI